MQPYSRRYLREVVYLNRTNAIRLRFRQWDPVALAWAAVPWTSVATWRVSLVDADGTVVGPFTSTDNPSMVDDSEAGVLAIALGELAITAGDYFLRVAAIDGGGEVTQIVHEAAVPDVVRVSVVDTTAAA